MTRVLKGDGGVGRGGVGVCSVPCSRRVAGSNPPQGGMFGALQPEGCGFESTSSRRVGTLGKSFTRNCSCASA